MVPAAAKFCFNRQKFALISTHFADIDKVHVKIAIYFADIGKNLLNSASVLWKLANRMGKPATSLASIGKNLPSLAKFCLHWHPLCGSRQKAYRNPHLFCGDRQKIASIGIRFASIGKQDAEMTTAGVEMVTAGANMATAVSQDRKKNGTARNPVQMELPAMRRGAPRAFTLNCSVSRTGSACSLPKV